jgi:PAS domain S-box-containing protein
MSKARKPKPEKTSRPYLLNERPPEEQLRLKDRALKVCAEGVTIADATQPDCPLIYVNRGFEKLTGYSASETCGHNCRFLQGKDTDSSAVDEIREAVNGKRECVVEILNYRKSGEPFWNRLSITPIRDDQETVTHFIGVQSDVTARRQAEAALKISNAELERANRIIKKDLQAAARIQASFLPPREPDVPGVAVAWEVIPCDELAGDTINVHCLSDRYTVFYVLDVSGHGVQASLLSVTLNHLLSPETGRDNGVASMPGESEKLSAALPIEVLNYLNRRFPFDPEIRQYFTIAYGVLDSHTNTFRFIAAGHPPPLYIPAGAAPEFQVLSNFPIGIMKDPSFREGSIQMRSGDRVYLYSDGLVEVSNAGGEHFGDERLAEELNRLSAKPLKSGLSSLVQRLRDWSGEDNLEDDVSILGFEIE